MFFKGRVRPRGVSREVPQARKVQLYVRVNETSRSTNDGTVTGVELARERIRIRIVRTVAFSNSYTYRAHHRTLLPQRSSRYPVDPWPEFNRQSQDQTGQLMYVCFIPHTKILAGWEPHNCDCALLVLPFYLCDASG